MYQILNHIFDVDKGDTFYFNILSGNKTASDMPGKFEDKPFDTNIPLKSIWACLPNPKEQAQS